MTERTARTRARKRNIQMAVLSAIGVGGLLLVSMAAPNVVQLLEKSSPGKQLKTKYLVRSALSRLRAKGQITFVEKGSRTYARLTEAGRSALEFELQRLALLSGSKRRWDKRWRVVSFDIPEKRKHVRDRLCSLMRQCGFVLLQNSVWVYPYECEEFVALAKAELRLGGSVLYLVVESIDNEDVLRARFGLGGR